MSLAVCIVLLGVLLQTSFAHATSWEISHSGSSAPYIFEGVINNSTKSHTSRATGRPNSLTERFEREFDDVRY